MMMNNNDQAADHKLMKTKFTTSSVTPYVKKSRVHLLAMLIIQTCIHSTNVMNLEHQWTKDHPLEQVHGNPSKTMQTRRQLITDLEMCMFVLTVSTGEPKNIKEAMANSAWIEAMQDGLHQLDRLQVWELIDKPFGKTVIKLKWLWKNKKDEDQTIIRNKARLVR
ncbi:hypothetical protein Tco_0441192 [Tanacetum coccineum]